MDTQTVFDILGDATRRRVLGLLLVEGELCVCELMAAMDEIQPKVSRHLSVMREAGLVTMRRDGTWIFYRIAPSLPKWMGKLLDTLRSGAIAELAAAVLLLRHAQGAAAADRHRLRHGHRAYLRLARAHPRAAVRPPPGVGNAMAASLGIVTPFCSCSAVPLFIGFLQAGVPLGVTFSFLIAAPMVNEIALAMLFGLFGWKIAALYLVMGLPSRSSPAS
jgi:DNA-binding transcriptional ArsR family regulator